MRATWVLALSLATGCTSSPNGPSAPTATPEGLILSVAATPAQLAPGRPLTIVVALANPTSNDVTLDFSDGCQLLYAVEDTSGRTVSPLFACVTMLTKLSVPSGSTKQTTATWDGRRELPSGGSEPVPAGTYRVYGVLGHGPIRSQPVTVVIGNE